MIRKINNQIKESTSQIIQNTKPRHLIAVLIFSIFSIFLISYYSSRADELYPDYIKNISIKNYSGNKINIVSVGESIQVTFDLNKDILASSMVNKILGLDASTSCNSLARVQDTFVSCTSYLYYDVNIAKSYTQTKANFSLSFDVLDLSGNTLNIYIDKTSDNSYLDLDQPTIAYYYSLGDVSIKSDNASSTIGESGDKVNLDFAMASDDYYDANQNLTVKILNKVVETICLDDRPVTYQKSSMDDLFSYLFITRAQAAINYPIKCKANLTLTQEDIDKYKPENIDFSISFNTWNKEINQVDKNFIVINTNDSSFVKIGSEPSIEPLYGDFISQVHIESDNKIDRTLAILNSEIVLTYNLNSNIKYDQNAVKILGKDAALSCQSVKDLPQDAQQLDQALESAQVATKSPKQNNNLDLANNLQVRASVKGAGDVVINTNKIAQPDLAIKYSADQTPVDSLSTSTFILKCTAIVNVNQDDISRYANTIVPFTIKIVTSKDRLPSQNFEINKTDDASFVKILSKSILSDVGPIAQPVEAVESSNSAQVNLPQTNLAPTVTQISGGVIMNPNSVNNSKNVAKIESDTRNLVKVCPIIPANRFYKLGSRSKDIIIIKREINEDLKLNMTLTDIFNEELFINLKKWQDKHADIVLLPWGEDKSTGYFYKTSNWAMNYLGGCTIPKYVLEKYKR